MRVKIEKYAVIFPDTWVDISKENPDGPPTFVDDSVEEPGVFQISTADYIAGEKPRPTEADLIDLSIRLGIRNNFGTIKSTGSGKCKLGLFGAAEFSGPEFPFITIWHLSNGKDFVFCTFICSKSPSNKERQDIESVVASIKKRGLFG